MFVLGCFILFVFALGCGFAQGTIFWFMLPVTCLMIHAGRSDHHRYSERVPRYWWCGGGSCIGTMILHYSLINTLICIFVSLVFLHVHSHRRELVRWHLLHFQRVPPLAEVSDCVLAVRSRRSPSKPCCSSI